MNSTGDELHPNWRALTTLHVPLKRFVRAGAADQEKGKVTKALHTIDGVSGAEVQKFYKEILETPETKRKTTNEDTTETKKEVKPLQPFDKNQFFRLATSNNVQELCQLCISSEEQLNSRDVYGWTALMMAACEGAADAVAWLLQLGANTTASDKSGNTALQLARRKGHAEIMQLLEAADEPQEEEEGDQQEDATGTAVAVAPFYCRVCQREYSESTWREHQTSTVHQFNMKSLPAHRLHKFNIPARNRGLQLMLKQGWDREHGLGPTQNGRLYPVKTVLRKQRTGLGIQQSAARVTHFEAFDLNATRYRNRAGGDPSRQPRRTRDDMRREKLQDWRRERRLRNELS